MSAAMNRITAFLSRIMNAPEWREIATVPFDRAVELAVIDRDISVLSISCLRHGDALAGPATCHTSGYCFQEITCVPVGLLIEINSAAARERVQRNCLRCDTLRRPCPR